MSFTFKPHKLRKKRRQGFLAKMSSKSGKRTINNRRRKGRKRLACE